MLGFYCEKINKISRIPTRCLDQEKWGSRMLLLRRGRQRLGKGGSLTPIRRMSAEKAGCLT
jgi:hypothetical protein